MLLCTVYLYYYILDVGCIYTFWIAYLNAVVSWFFFLVRCMCCVSFRLHLLDIGSQLYLRHKSRCVSLTSTFVRQELIVSEYQTKMQTPNVEIEANIYHRANGNDELTSKCNGWIEETPTTSGKRWARKNISAYYHALVSASPIDYISDTHFH